MDTNAELGPQTETAETPKTTAQKAEDMLVQASIRYSGLTEAQITYIALQCKDQHLNPLELRDALLAESGKTADLTGLANGMHEKHRPKVPSELWKRMIRQVKIFFNGEEEPRVVTEQDVIRVIKGNFAIAQERMAAPSAKLEEILKLYPQFKDKNKLHGDRQEDYTEMVNEILSRPDSQKSETSAASKTGVPRKVLAGKE